VTALITLETGAVTVLRLANPPLHLVTLELTDQLDAALAEIEETSGIGAVIVAGNPRSFCAGSDIGEFESLHGRVAEGKLSRENAVYSRLANLPVPTIAAIEGSALGGGLELALCCDFRVAAATARIGLPEVGLGAIPGSGGTQRLPRLVGPGRAKHLILTGTIIDGAAAGEIGLVEVVAAAGEAEDTARAIAAGIADKGPLAVREAKRAIDRGLDLCLEEGLAAELEGSERVFSSQDLLEGARAFAAKRRPRFRGS